MSSVEPRLLTNNNVVGVLSFDSYKAVPYSSIIGVSTSVGGLSYTFGTTVFPEVINQDAHANPVNLAKAVAAAINFSPGERGILYSDSLLRHANREVEAYHSGDRVVLVSKTGSTPTISGTIPSTGTTSVAGTPCGFYSFTLSDGNVFTINPIIPNLDCKRFEIENLGVTGSVLKIIRTNSFYLDAGMGTTLEGKPRDYTYQMAQGTSLPVQFKLYF